MLKKKSSLPDIILIYVVIYLTLKFVFALFRFLISPLIFHQWILVSELDKPKYSAIDADVCIVEKENLGSFGSSIN